MVNGSNLNHVVIADKDADIILPPSSAVNPIPALPAAVRVDNAEQLLHLLTTDPNNNNHNNIPSSHAATTTTTTTTTSSFRQYLVFGTERLRTLVLRQVLTDPHNRTWQNKQTNKAASKSNWDDVLEFHYPRGLDLVGTQVLLSTNTAKSSLTSQQQQEATTRLDFSNNKNVHVVTYFLHPTQLAQTRAAIACIRNAASSTTSSSSSQQASLPLSSFGISSTSNDSSSSSAAAAGAASFRIHHRLVYVPTVNMAMINQILQHAGVLQQHNVSVNHNLQLDFLCLETDVVSMEYPGALHESSAGIDGMPSHVVTCAARSLLKLQDVTGKIPRIQTYGSLAEATLKKLMHMTVNEHLASSQEHDVNNSGYNNSVDMDMLADSVVEAMLIIDRKVDMVTPMLTPLTYEGLLDDVFGIDCGFLNVNVDIINPPDDEADDSSSNAAENLSPSNRKKKADDKSKKKHNVVALGVNASDSLYAEVRNHHVEKFGSFLQNQAMALRQSHAEFTSTRGKKKDLQEIHNFVKNIPIFTQNLRSLTNHIHLAERIKKTTEHAHFRERWQTERSMLEGEVCLDQLEDFIANCSDGGGNSNSSGNEDEDCNSNVVDSSPLRFLRLLCLQSLCAGGIKSSRYDALRRDVVQTFGYEYVFVVMNAGVASLSGQSSSAFASLRKQLLLINSEVDTVEPDDVSFVSSGYAPLSVRLIQTAVRGWTAVRREEILKELLPGGGARMLDLLQTSPPCDFITALQQPGTTNLTNSGLPLATSTTTTNQRPAAAATVNDGRSASPATAASTASRKKPVLIVFYLGGVTYMEITALRFLSRRQTFPFHILIMTTEILNGSRLLQSLS
jgi:vacuolar protein sorting-associated protein 33A